MSFSVDQVVAECREAARSANGHAGAAVEEVVARAVSDPAAIEAAIGAPETLPPMTVWSNDDDLTVLHLVWPPGVELTAHDHLMWAAIGLYGGREDNVLYRVLPEGGLEERKQMTLGRGDTVLLGHDTVHAVNNPSREWTGAIHVYGGNYFIPGRHMWLDTDAAGADFDVDHVVGTIEAAAVAARAAPPEE